MAANRKSIQQALIEGERSGKPQNFDFAAFKQRKLAEYFPAVLPLAEIDGVVFYKRDEITTDLICCDIELGGRIWTFHEEAQGWRELIAHISALPGFRADWFSAVANPAFETNRTIAFQRQ